MENVLVAVITITCFAGVAPAARRPHDVAVPSTCTPQVNQQLSRLLNSGQQNDVYNVMVCGVTTQPSQTQYGGPNGDHQVLSLRVALLDGSTKLIEVVANDVLDGVVTAPANAQVFAYGRAYFSDTHQYAAGVDEVHCATNSHADNGWVSVNGVKYPKACGM